MTEKIAVLSDIHGNVTALKAVLADAKKSGATDYWLLGDIFLPGPANADIVTLLQQLPLSVYVRGNWDDSILEVLAGDFDINQPSDIYFARLTQYLLEQSGQEVLDFIKEAPMTAVKNIHGLTCHLSHHLPDKNYGSDLLSQASQEKIDHLFENRQIDLALYGHTHFQLWRYSSQGQLLINPGSVGQPYFRWKGLKSDLRAQYAILEIDEQGIANLQFKKVAFDLEQEIKLAKDRHLPYLELYQELLETGVLHTHDDPLLAKINAQHAYQAEIVSYFKNLVIAKSN